MSPEQLKGWYDISGDYDCKTLESIGARGIIYYALAGPGGPSAVSIVAQLSGEQITFYKLAGWIIEPADKVGYKVLGFEYDFAEFVTISREILLTTRGWWLAVSTKDQKGL